MTMPQFTINIFGILALMATYLSYSSKTNPNGFVFFFAQKKLLQFLVTVCLATILEDFAFQLRHLTYFSKQAPRSPCWRVPYTFYFSKNINLNQS